MMKKEEASKVKQKTRQSNTAHPSTVYIHVLMRDEKEGRKKEASKVKQKTRQSNTAHPCTVYIHVLMRDERRKEERSKKEASKVKQKTRQSNTAHPRQSTCATCIILYMYIDVPLTLM